MCCLKSSNWMRQPGQTSWTPWTNASTNASYAAPRRRGRPIPQVERVLEERVVVRPDVERDRQRQDRVDAARRGVQGELPDRDRHPAGTLVAEAQDPLVVGHDDQPDVLVGRGAEDLGDAVPVRRCQPDPARPPDDVAELLARPPDRRRVDDRQVLLQVRREEAIEQRGVPVLEGRETDVALEVVAFPAEVLVLELQLLLHRQDAVRQEAVEPELGPLVEREREVLGEEPAIEELVARNVDLGREPGEDPVEGVGQRSHDRSIVPRRAAAGARAIRPPPRLHSAA